jgi:hypothetical protein
MHYQLWRLLGRSLPSSASVNPVFLANPVLQSIAEKGHLYSPGDQLTLLYIFHPNISRPGQEKLLAARAMVYSKILKKQESADDAATFPHLRDELSCIRSARRLSIDDCRLLFPPMRRAGTLEARGILEEFLREKNQQGSFIE